MLGELTPPFVWKEILQLSEFWKGALSFGLKAVAKALAMSAATTVPALPPAIWAKTPAASAMRSAGP